MDKRCLRILVEHAIAAAVAEERVRCARIADKFCYMPVVNDWVHNDAFLIAARIRAGEEP